MSTLLTQQQQPPPPPPLAKPGRIRVYRAISEFIATQANGLKLDEGDIVYLKEAKENEHFCEARCVEKGGTTGRIPREFVETHLELIKFPLHEAAKMGDLDFLKECLDNNVSVNSLDSSGSTALHWAAYTGHTRVLQHLISVPNVALSAQNKLGDTPLHAASAKGRLDCVQLLVEAGANVHMRNREGKKPVEGAGNARVGALLRTTMAERGADEEYLEEEAEEGEEGTAEG